MYQRDDILCGGLALPDGIPLFDPTYRTLCRLASSQACPEFHRRADAAFTSTLGSDDWRLLAATARREGVAPLLYHALKEQRSRDGRVQGRGGEQSSSPHLPISPSPQLSCVPPDVQTDLRQAYYATTARNLLIYRELSRILAALAAGPPDRNLQSPISNLQLPTSNLQPPIPVILLKGAALAATLYPSIGLRPMGDLDILVPGERLAEAVACLKALGYIEPYPEMAAGLNALAGHHVNLQGGRDIHLTVELHWTLIGGEHDWRSPSLPWFWQQTEPIPNTQSPIPNTQYSISNLQPPTSILQLTPTAHLLYLCAHLMLQHGEARSVLRWFYDIHLLVTQESHRIDWDELILRAQEFHWAAALYAALAGTAARFATPLPAGLLESLMDGADPRDQALVQRKARLQTRWESISDALASISWRARLRRLLAITIPSPTYMRWRYKPHPVWLWPLCYPYRWLDILREGLSTLWKIGRGRTEGEDVIEAVADVVKKSRR